MQKYSFNMADNLSGVDALVIIQIFNPVGSERLISIEKVSLSIVDTKLSGATPALRGTRMSQVSDGILQPFTSYGRLDTTAPEPRATIQIGGAEVALLADIFSMARASVSTAAGELSGIQQDFLSENSPIILQEGEGFAITRTIGDSATCVYNITIYWDEKLGVRRYRKETE